MTDATDPTPAPPSRTRRIATWTINLLLVAIIVGLIVAMWLPIFLDESPARGLRDNAPRRQR